MEEQIIKGLSGKRIALAGVAGEQANELSTAFDEVQAFCRVLDIDQVQPQSLSLNVYDLVIFRLENLSGEHSWLQSDDIEQLKKPVLAIGPLTALSTHMTWIQEHASDFLTTPANPAEVVLRSYGVLSRVAHKEAPQLTPARQNSVVIADDDATTIALVKAVIERNNLQCHVARDGGEALRLIGEVLPQAAVLDVNMPHLDGFEVLAGVRNDPRTNHIPVIVLTSRQLEADIIRAFNLGADDYIPKPFSPMELVARLRRLMRSRQA